MKLIKPSYQIWNQDLSITDSNKSLSENLLDNMYKHIEKCGRVCYKSEDKITDISAKPFVDRLEKSQHLAMLEHGTVYLLITHEDVGNMSEEELRAFCAVADSPYSKVVETFDRFIYITTNYRVIIENKAHILLSYISVPDENFKKRVTVHFTCNRQVSHEFVRHKLLCVA